MNSILRRSLVFVGIMVAGLVFYSVWFDMEAERYDETAVPYLNDAIPKLVSWKFSRLKPLLSPEALKEAESEQGQAVYRIFSQLGKFYSMGKPQYLADKSEHSEGLGNIRIVSYTVPVDFETGPAIVKLNLASVDDSYYIHHFGIHSELFVKE